MNNLSRQIALVASATESINRAVADYAERVSIAGSDESGIHGDLMNVLTKLSGLTLTLERERTEQRRRWDEYEMFIPVIVGCGKARLRLACSKPNDRTDNPWTTVSVYESLKRKLVAHEGERIHAEGSFPVDVINRTGTIVYTIKPLSTLV